MVVRNAIISKTGEPTWEITKLFPNQGDWSEHEYLALDTNQLIEFTSGRLEFLPMPTPAHQRIVFFLQRLLWAYMTERNLGEVLAAPLRVRLGFGKFREPDIVLVTNEHLAQQGKQYWEHVDLVMEVVSPDDPNRDYVQKRQEYAEAGIAEYWIVDPMQETIIVLALQNDVYAVHGEFTPGQNASSQLLDGFSITVSEVFAAAE